MSGINAAIGIAQLDHFEKTETGRRALWRAYPGPRAAEGPRHRRGVHYPPNHLQPAFAQWRRDLPATEQAGHEILTLPLHQHLTEADIDQVVTALGQALTEARTTPHADQSQQ
ncbi:MULTISPECIES: DegT/DnrJ/EryC1/StrS family aminotransferase [unclassified Streptomyces]|uniref:DegT/DnrJ/EryC1/StrS family aminotransferase n=1 Tax=unclassified Streptomyces TaxID=2593676 RepID=UPI003323A01D